MNLIALVYSIESTIGQGRRWQTQPKFVSPLYVVGIFFKENGQSSWVGTPLSGGPQAHVDRSALLDLDRNKTNSLY